MEKLNKKILIVEDEKYLLDIMKEELEDAGFAVVTAADGQEGLIAIEKENPDLMLLDIAMPKMDGIQVLRELKNKDKTIPVIMLTNLDDLDHVGKALDLGLSDYLVKSNWKLEEVIKRVKEKLDLSMN